MARILVVDDAKFMRVTLARILEKDNHEVIEMATDGQEAIEKYIDSNPDLVLMDITMPEMSGIEALKKIIDYDKQAACIICSAMGQQKVVIDAIETGAKDFIVKPFDEERVLETVHQVLHKLNLVSTDKS